MQHYICLSSHAKKQVSLTYLKMTDYTFLFYEQKKISQTYQYLRGMIWNELLHSVTYLKMTTSANSTKHRFIQVQYGFGSVQSMKLVMLEAH